MQNNIKLNIICPQVLGSLAFCSNNPIRFNKPYIKTNDTPSDAKIYTAFLIKTNTPGVSFNSFNFNGYWSSLD